MKAFSAILACVFCFGCSTSSTSGPDKKDPVKPVRSEADEPVVDGMQAVVEGNNQFAFDLYHQLAQKPGNKFFSPYSISTALAMTYAGARGNTAKEMAQTLHFTLDDEGLHPAFGGLIRKIQGAGKKRSYELAVANSLWGAKGLSLEPTFLRVTQTDYQAGFEVADFVRDPEEARRRINGWVEDQTNKKIEDLFPKGLIDANTRLVLVNAIYFKGDWATPFPKAATREEDFMIPGAPAFKVPMMNHTFVAKYMSNEDFQLAQFMYKDNEVSMVVILPRKKDGLPEVEKKLSAKALEQALALVGVSRLQVTLPKFKMTEEFRLDSELRKLGMKEAFLQGAADFSGMTRQNSLFVSAVVHKAFVNIDEKGTEAAAATGVVMAKKAPPPFRVAHPFLFLLRHNSTGSILFLGRVVDPRRQ
jgi:serpin B